MDDVLQTIVARRREDVALAQARIPLNALIRKARARNTPRSLVGTLSSAKGTSIIAEMKRASPSAGAIRSEYDPADISRRYSEAGACGLSVLTEPHWFKGLDEDLQAARASTALPVLRKDFVVDPYQVYETAAMDSDVVLLIVAVLDRPSLRELYQCARDCGLDVLVESHTETELELALELEDAIVGVNSRDLRTLKTDLNTARRLAALIPGDRLAIAESGIRTRADIESLEQVGYRGFLVGETLMRASDPGGALRTLLGA